MCLHFSRWKDLCDNCFYPKDVSYRYNSHCFLYTHKQQQMGYSGERSPCKSWDVSLLQPQDNKRDWLRFLQVLMANSTTAGWLIGFKYLHLKFYNLPPWGITKLLSRVCLEGKPFTLEKTGLLPLLWGLWFWLSPLCSLSDTTRVNLIAVSQQF